jgi:hypothetical protein
MADLEFPHPNGEIAFDVDADLVQIVWEDGHKNPCFS